MHVKKGDKVIVIAGKEKGKTSTIVRAIPETNRVVLDGINLVKKHTKPKKAGDKGGIIDVAQSIHASNVKLADGKKKKEVKKDTKSKSVKVKKVVEKDNT